MPDLEKRKTIAEFSFTKGMLMATFSGIMSACFAYGLTAGNPISEASLNAGTRQLWSGLPKLVVVLFGGFTTNFIWCVLLNLRNRTGYQYFSSKVRSELPKREQETIIETPMDAPSEEVVLRAPKGNQGAYQPSRSPCFLITFSRRSPAQAGTCNFSFIPWGRRKWGNSVLPVGPCTWRASLFSALAGGFISTNGKAPARKPISLSLAVSRRSSFPH